MANWAGDGHARVSFRQPRAFALCDRCGMRYNHDRLRWQFNWQGVQLVNLRLLVCPTCLDTPDPQGRQYPLPPDPVPVMDPRPDPYAGLVDGVQILTESGLSIRPDGGYLAPYQGIASDDIET